MLCAQTRMFDKCMDRVVPVLEVSPPEHGNFPDFPRAKLILCPFYIFFFYKLHISRNGASMVKWFLSFGKNYYLNLVFDSNLEHGNIGK